MDGPLARAPVQRSPLSARAFGPDLLLGELIGRGGMSRVYHGWIRGSGADVAVKILRDDLASRPDAVRGFVRERDLLSTVASPHVVPVHDLVVVGDELGIVMDLVRGGHLRRAVSFPCDAGDAAGLAAQIADGLAAVHAAGVVHRDLKPENVLVDVAEDAAPLLRLTDFGISRLVDAAHLTQTSVTGTPGYLAPEVAAGSRATKAADVYALGVILYELLTGRGPFVAGNSLVLILAHTRLEPPRPDGVPDPLWEVLAAMLAKDPAVRPQAAELASRLRRLAPQLRGLGPFTAPEVAVPVDDLAGVGRAATAPGTVALGAPATVPAPAGAPATAPAGPRTPPGPSQGPGRGPRPGPRHTPTSGAAVGPNPGHGLVGGPPGRPRGADAGGGERDRRPALLLAAGVGVLLLVGGLVAAVASSSGRGSEVLVVGPTGTSPTWSAPAGPGPATSGGGTRPDPRMEVITRSPSAATSAPTSPSPTASGSSPSATVTPGVPTLRRDTSAAELTSSDEHVSFVVSKVTAGVTTVTIRWDDGQAAATASPDDPTRWTATADDLTNGTDYTFTALACTTPTRCTTSAPLTATPYGQVEVVAPVLSLAGTRISVDLQPVRRHANPGTLDCSWSVDATPDDSSAPGGRSITAPASPGTPRFTGRAATSYTVTETCRVTVSGTTSTVSATSTAVAVPAASPSPSTSASPTPARSPAAAAAAPRAG